MIDSPTRLLGMFAKYWQPCQVKTRLGREIGHELASQLYLKFVQTLLDRLSAAGDERTLFFTPVSRGEEFQFLCDGTSWQLLPQSDGDLGHRMSDYFQRQLASEARRVLLIGSDSPTLPTRLIDQAFDVLGNHDLVFGPSHDGGYYLIGMKHPHPAIFSDIDWSTDRVLRQTLDRLSVAYPQADVGLLERWYDVDSLGDVRRLHAELLKETAPSAVIAELRELCKSALNS